MKVFGTDGIRGEVGGPLINPRFFARLGKAVGHFLATLDPEVKTVGVGRDPRASGPSLAAAFAGGLRDSGVSVEIVDLGVLPSPGTSNWVSAKEQAFGVMLTASHNPETDNGIKFFRSNGSKLTDADQEVIEAALDAIEEGEVLLNGNAFDQVIDGAAAYREDLRRDFANLKLSGRKVFLDTANGATVVTSPLVLEALGAEVEVIGGVPDGTNINAEVGSEHPEALIEAVRNRGGEAIGIAHDGDGDRVLVVDEQAAVFDGDRLLAVLAIEAKRQGSLTGDTLVVTNLSNLALDRYLAPKGIRVERVGVGDRQVSAAMQAGGYRLGGEASGHIIDRNAGETGDGLGAALRLLQALDSAGGQLSELGADYEPFPMETRNYRVSEKPPLDSVPGFSAQLEAIQSDLGNAGRVLVRYSGTEPKVRLLVEASSPELVASTLAKAEAVLRDLLPVSEA